MWVKGLPRHLSRAAQTCGERVWFGFGTSLVIADVGYADDTIRTESSLYSFLFKYNDRWEADAGDFRQFHREGVCGRLICTCT